MPLTTAHPAASIPLRHVLGRFGVLSALVIGSGMPDMAYFVPLGVTREQTHAPSALLWYALPLGLACWVVWQRLLRPAVVQLLLPATLAARLEAEPAKSSWTAVVISLLVGAATHLVWDAFTHSSGPLVELVTPLRATVLEVRGRPVPFYKVLQYGSSVLGTMLVAYWAWQWIVRARPVGSPSLDVATRRARIAAWAVLLIVPAAAALAAGLVRWSSTRDALGSFEQLRAFANGAIRAGGAVFAGSVLVIAAVWHARAARG